MRLEELRTELDHLAGPAHEAPPAGVQEVHRTARRHQRIRVAATTSALILVLAVIGTLLLHTDSTTPRVESPADSVPVTTTLPQPPPPFDAKAFFAQPRIGVSDETGKVRGTIPMSAYKAAMGLTADGVSPPSAQEEVTKVPVITDDGKLGGYWIPILGFVERSVADAPGFDARALAAKNEAKAWANFTPEERQKLIAQGITPPSTTGDRVLLYLPDGSSGWINRIEPPNINGLSYAAGIEAIRKYDRTLVPVTKTKDPSSTVLGYNLVNIGFVPKSVADTPGFDIDAVVAHGPCTYPLEVGIVDGDYTCVAAGAGSG